MEEPKTSDSFSIVHGKWNVGRKDHVECGKGEMLIEFVVFLLFRRDEDKNRGDRDFFFFCKWVFWMTGDSRKKKLLPPVEYDHYRVIPTKNIYFLLRRYYYVFGLLIHWLVNSSTVSMLIGNELMWNMKQFLCNKTIKWSNYCRRPHSYVLCFACPHIM